MKISDKGLVALILHEGVVPGPYMDSEGVWTFGVGHTRGAGEPDPAKMQRGVPTNLDGVLREVFDLFGKDIALYERRVNDALKVPVTQHEFDALVSFDYNTGSVDSAVWVRKLNDGDRVGAAKDIMNWKKPESIIPRRKAEQRLFRDGVYPKGTMTVWGVNTNGQVIWKPLTTLTDDEVFEYIRENNDFGKKNVSKKGPLMALGLSGVFAAIVVNLCNIPFLANLFNLQCGG